MIPYFATGESDVGGSLIPSESGTSAPAEEDVSAAMLGEVEAAGRIGVTLGFAEGAGAAAGSGGISAGTAFPLRAATAGRGGTLGAGRTLILGFSGWGAAFSSTFVSGAGGGVE